MEIIRCFTCNSLIGHKFSSFQKELQLLKQSQKDTVSHSHTDILQNSRFFEDISYLDIFKKLKIDNDCCRRHFMTNISAVYNGDVQYKMYHDIHPWEKQ